MVKQQIHEFIMDRMPAEHYLRQLQNVGEQIKQELSNPMPMKMKKNR